MLKLTCHSSVGSLIDEVAMMEMSEGGGVGNAAFDATGDDLDSRQQQATEKVYSFITFSAQQRKRVVLLSSIAKGSWRMHWSYVTEFEKARAFRLIHEKARALSQALNQDC